MDVLCTDKTGTLTQGTVQLNSAFDRQGQPSETAFRLAYFNAYFQSGLDNALDKAILAHRTLEIASIVKVGEILYDFHRKRLSIIYQMGPDITMTTKGALEIVLEVCSSIQVGNVIQALDSTERESIHKQLADWSAQGYRVLGIAFKQVLSNQRRFSHKDECDLTFAGFLLFLDPPKSDAAVTLHDLTALGVSVKVITGDNKLVAVHALETIGVTIDGILTGSQMAKMPDQALWLIAEQTTLFAEVDPNQKERIILALHKDGACRRLYGGWD